MEARVTPKSVGVPREESRFPLFVSVLKKSTAEALENVSKATATICAAVAWSRNNNSEPTTATPVSMRLLNGKLVWWSRTKKESVAELLSFFSSFPWCGRRTVGVRFEVLDRRRFKEKQLTWLALANQAWWREGLIKSIRSVSRNRAKLWFFLEQQGIFNMDSWFLMIIVGCCWIQSLIKKRATHYVLVLAQVRVGRQCMIWVAWSVKTNESQWQEGCFVLFLVDQH